MDLVEMDRAMVLGLTPVDASEKVFEPRDQSFERVAYSVRR